MNQATITKVQVSFAGALAMLSACMGEVQPQQASSSPKPDLRVVFQAAYSQDGRLTVTEDGTGRLGVGITGTTGVDDPAEIGNKLRRSLVETHRALLPDAEVPARLVDLNQRFMIQYAGGTKRTVASDASGPLIAPSAAPSTSVARVTSFSSPEESFNADFCRYRKDNGFESVPIDCWYVYNWERACYWHEWNPDDGTDAFPAAFARNDGGSGASLWGRYTTLTVYSGQWALAVLARIPQEVCFDYEGTSGDFGLTKSWGQTIN